MVPRLPTVVRRNPDLRAQQGLEGSQELRNRLGLPVNTLARIYQNHISAE